MKKVILVAIAEVLQEWAKPAVLAFLIWALVTDKADQFMQDGIHSKRNVSRDFAESYEKGRGDAYRHLYASMHLVQPQPR